MTLIEKSLEKDINIIITPLEDESCSYRDIVIFKEKLFRRITQALQEQDRESISKAFRVVMNIYIPHDNSDSEIHQLRFKEKIVAYAKQHNIDLHEN